MSEMGLEGGRQGIIGFLGFAQLPHQCFEGAAALYLQPFFPVYLVNIQCAVSGQLDVTPGDVITADVQVLHELSYRFYFTIVQREKAAVFHTVIFFLKFIGFKYFNKFLRGDIFIVQGQFQQSAANQFDPGRNPGGTVDADLIEIFGIIQPGQFFQFRQSFLQEGIKQIFFFQNKRTLI